MGKTLFLASALLLSVSLANAKKRSEAKAPEFPETTARGRMLAEYLTAARQARQAVLALHPLQGTITHFTARKDDAGWVVAFGRYNEMGDRFLIAYEAMQGPHPDDFTAKQIDPPRDDAGFFRSAAKAIDTVGADLQVSKSSLHYETAVLPAESGQMYVYFLPAQTSPKVYIYGGDFRYLVSSAAMKIVEIRQLHKTVLTYGPQGIPTGAKLAGGFHTHILSDVPEDTDVAMVLLSKPTGPEAIGTRSGAVYEVLEDGTIVRAR